MMPKLHEAPILGKSGEVANAKACDEMRVEDDILEKLERYLRLVLEQNEKVNLTSIKGFEEGKLLHIEDSLAALPYIEDKHVVACDMGSGNGFPGVALAMASNIHFDLIEATAKKAVIIDHLVHDLGFQHNVRVINQRIEELGPHHTYGVVTARGLGPLAVLLELASPLLDTGGQLIAYKARLDASDPLPSDEVCEKLGYGAPIIEEYKLSDGKTCRALVVYEKTHDASVQLPRRPGMAQKRPYK